MTQIFNIHFTLMVGSFIKIIAFTGPNSAANNAG